MMKAGAIATLASLALAAPVSAQHVEFGPRLGLAFSTVSVKSPSGQNNSEENSITDALDIQLDYLEIPLLLVVPVTGASSASASLYGGTALALEASCHGTMTGLPSRDHFDCDNPNFDVFDRRKMDMGATAGGAVRVPMGSGALVADLRYTLGFTNLNKETGDEVCNRSTMITLGYSIVR